MVMELQWMCKREEIHTVHLLMHTIEATPISAHHATAPPQLWATRMQVLYRKAGTWQRDMK